MKLALPPGSKKGRQSRIRRKQRRQQERSEKIIITQKWVEEAPTIETTKSVKTEETRSVSKNIVEPVKSVPTSVKTEVTKSVPKNIIEPFKAKSPSTKLEVTKTKEQERPMKEDKIETAEDISLIFSILYLPLENQIAELSNLSDQEIQRLAKILCAKAGTSDSAIPASKFKNLCKVIVKNFPGKNCKYPGDQPA